ncbi:MULTISPECIES: siroheme synthase CysG [Vitreoscilla]|uniref:Siroheme synthase n=1 Tax=Vitreoscilla stercoraria TaxID=61 RepID=A0ABY4EGW5_VITST|nr:MULTISPECIES: siroheme synthase CysG [Vitreoscilla]AUZ05990.1 siroheme synthase [Vitreoscilla sp. C1]UOO92637.1 siroheme synthase CysG [Vitreoscilla stercoraria]
MDYYPLFARLQQRPVLVVGAGQVAERKVDSLLQSGAIVRLVAPELNAVLQQWLDAGRIEHIATEFAPEHIQNVFLVVAATNDAALNQQIFAAAEAAHTLCNVVDDLQNCNFIVPALIDRGALQIAISTGGKAPVLARIWRQKIEALLPEHLSDAANIAGRWRGKVKERIHSMSARRQFWERLFHSRFDTLTAQGKLTEAENEIETQLQNPPQQNGQVVLVGAGPGDVGLMTLKGLQALQDADIVLYDALVSDDILNLIRKDAQRISVGKRAGNHSVMQEKTNELLVQYALEGKRVVRLKGGDPFVFGRGGEELQVLQQAGIAYRVIPGITAGLGATAYAGIPLTHRKLAQTATFITGHCQADGSDIDWQSLALSRHTLVVYMGTINAATIAEQLQQHGRSSDTPVAVISNGTRENQSTNKGVLKDLPQLTSNAPSPALIVIGEVVSLHEQLAWFGEHI